MPSFSLIVRGNAKDVANKVSSLIFEHRHRGNLKRSKIEQLGEKEFIVSYWSVGGVFHDCEIDVFIKQMNDTYSIATFSCCCATTEELAKIVANYLEY